MSAFTFVGSHVALGIPRWSGDLDDAGEFEYASNFLCRWLDTRNPEAAVAIRIEQSTLPATQATADGHENDFAALTELLDAFVSLAPL